jgi:small subunit ribosomal protein S17
MTEEERENQQSPEETPDEGLAEQDLVEEAEPLVSGPRYDQDEGRVQSAATGRNTRKERVGMVVSDAPQKTVTVRVETLVRHPKYKKRVRRSKKYLVHDEENMARVGDTVRIIETRPLSARKRWRLAHIVSRAE